MPQIIYIQGGYHTEAVVDHSIPFTRQHSEVGESPTDGYRTAENNIESYASMR